MAAKKKVLVVGREPSDFVCPLFNGFLAKYKEEFEVDLFEVRGKPYIRPCAEKSFSKVLDIPLTMKSYTRKEMLGAVTTTDFVKDILAKGSVKDAVRESVLNKTVGAVIAEYDIIHIFFITPELFMFFNAINMAKKLVVSFWGADLFNNDKDFAYEKQKRLIERADVVSVHHKEMREIFLSKFGRHHIDKLREMFVAGGSGFLAKFINALPQKQEYIRSFKKKHGISGDKRLVTIGHSGTHIDDHARIVASLHRMPRVYVGKICLVFPMTYDYDEEYTLRVERACEQLQVQAVFLKEFLSLEDLMELRLATEVLLRISKIDALSLAVCEALCSGTVMIAGAWLPYGKLRGNNVYYQEVYEMEDTGLKLMEVLDNFDLHVQRSQNNHEHVLKVFEKEDNVTKLYKIYTDA